MGRLRTLLRVASRVLGLSRRDVPGCVVAAGVTADSFTLAAIATPEDMERMEARLLAGPQPHVPIVHRFAPGVYMRTAIMQPGVYVGHEHTTEHLNVILRGSAQVICWAGGERTVRTVKAGDVFSAEPGVRKMVRVLEPCEWANVHPTEETDLVKIEANFIKKSATWERNAAALRGKEQPCLG